MKNKIVQVSSLFTFSMLGASYLTGAEWLYFFSYYGSWGTIGLLLACGALTWLVYRVACIASAHSIYSLADFVQIVSGPSSSQTITFILYTLLLGCGGVIMGQEALNLSEITKLPVVVCSLFLIVLLFFLLRIDFNKMSLAASQLLIVCAVILVVLFFAEAHVSMPSLTYQLNISWLWHAVLFIALHLLLSLAILLPVIGTSESPASVWIGIWLGGGIFTIIALLLHFLILAFWHDVHQSSQPLVLIITSIVPYGSSVIPVISLAQAALSIMLLYYSLIMPLTERYQLEYTPLQLFFLLVTFLVSILPVYVGWFATSLYTLLTYVGLYFLVLLLYKRI